MSRQHGGSRDLGPLPAVNTCHVNNEKKLFAHSLNAAFDFHTCRVDAALVLVKIIRRTRMNHLFLGFSMLSETIMTKPFDTVFNVLTRMSSSLLLHGVSRYCT